MTQIHVGVQAVVTARRDRTALLLGKRRGVFGDGQWALPGGHLEFGESFEEAVKRELEEEVGIKAAAIEYLSSINTAYTANAPGTHYVQIGMQVMDYKGEPENKEPDRCSELRWFSLDEPMPKPIFAPSQPFVDLMHRRRQASKEARSSRLSIYMHRIDIKLNMDKYVSYDLLADVPMLIVRFGRSNEANSRQLRVYTPRSFDQGLDFLRKEISKRLAHHYRLSDITGSLSIDLARSFFPPGTVAFRSVSSEDALLDSWKDTATSLVLRRASSSLGSLFVDHYEQPTLFDDWIEDV